MNKKRKVLIIILFSIITLVGGVLFMVNNMNKGVKQEVTIRTDKEAIQNRFPNIGEINQCYWKADVFGKEGNKRVTGPSAYWMKGFIEIDSDKIDHFIEKYSMKEVNEDLHFDFLPKNFDKKSSKWFFSNDFNDYIKPPSFFGKFYINSGNKVIYFDVRK